MSEVCGGDADVYCLYSFSAKWKKDFGERERRRESYRSPAGFADYVMLNFISDWAFSNWASALW